MKPAQATYNPPFRLLLPALMLLLPALTLLLPALLLLLPALMLLFCVDADAQQFPHRLTAHQEQSATRPGTPSEDRYPNNIHRHQLTKPQLTKPRRVLTHAVFGYHPYWIAESAIDDYRFDLLSHVAYFAYEVDPSTGAAADIHDWLTTALVDRAQAAGTNVLLVVTNFGATANRTFLSSPRAQDTLIANLTRLLDARSAAGVNIDFEAVPGDQRDNLTAFFTRLRQAFPGRLITVAAPAVDWSGTWNLPALSPLIDLFFIMGYDYYWSGSANAGPVAPLQGGNYNVRRTMQWYLDEGVPADRLLLGVPYYGLDWPVQDDSQNSTTTGRATSRTYSAAQGLLASHGRRWSDSFLNPWIPYRTSNWRQCWYDDSVSLALKYDYVLELGIAGVGMWALGYDRGFDELWNLLQTKFSAQTGIGILARPATFEIAGVWPQPLRRGNGILSVQLETVEGGDITVTVFDMLGRQAAGERRMSLSRGTSEFRLPVSMLTAGQYILRIGDGRHYRTRLFVLN